MKSAVYMVMLITFHIGLNTQASSQTLDEVLRSPGIEVPVPICDIDPIFCEPGPEDLEEIADFRDGVSVLESGEMSTMRGAPSNSVIVVDPETVYIAPGQVFIVPEGVEDPFVEE